VLKLNSTELLRRQEREREMSLMIPGGGDASTLLKSETEAVVEVPKGLANINLVVELEESQPSLFPNPFQPHLPDFLGLIVCSRWTFLHLRACAVQQAFLSRFLKSLSKDSKQIIVNLSMH
jgi:hypothetical protein